MSWIHDALRDVVHVAPASFVTLQIAALPPSTRVVPATTQFASLVHATDSAVAFAFHVMGVGDVQDSP